MAAFADAHIRELSQIEKIGNTLYAMVEHEDVRKMVLDFRKVRTLSSQALGILINLRKKISEQKGELVLCALSPEIMQLFKIAQLKSLFKFTEDEASALAALGVTAPA